MSDNKIQATINGDNIELKDDTYQYVSIPISEWQELKERIDSTVPPINPETGKPYFETRDDAWSGEWVANEVKPIPNSEFGGDDE